MINSLDEPPILSPDSSLHGVSTPRGSMIQEPPVLAEYKLPESQNLSIPSKHLSHRRKAAATYWRWLNPIWLGKGLFQFLSLVSLLAIASSIPILQLAALGYMLEVGRRIARKEPGVDRLPGLHRATRIGVMSAGAFFCWLPVWLVSDYAYTASLIDSQGMVAKRWNLAAWALTFFWITHVVWAALRGGRWYHFLWPAPIRFLREIWRPSTWRKAEDGLWQYTVGLRLPYLSWLGLRASMVGLAWLAIPAGMMIIGVQANHQPIRVLIGIFGAVAMMIVLMYLPFLQILMARENRLRSGFDVSRIRADFRRAPWAFFFAFFITLTMAIPLFLFRIESLPKELLWVPCLFFVLLTLPARALCGWAIRRGHREIPYRRWYSRWFAWSLQVASVPVYVLLLYLASIASWDGRLIFFIQHAFLVPVPFSGN